MDDLLLRRREMMASLKKGQRNLWNMNHPNLYVGAPGFNVGSKVIAADGTLTLTNRSGSSASRVSVSLTAEQLELEEGKTYTVKIWATDNDITTSRDSVIITNNTNTFFRGPAPFAKTWVQSGGYGVQVGLLYWQNYAIGSTIGFRVMVAEGDHIDNYVPYSS